MYKIQSNPLSFDLSIWSQEETRQSSRICCGRSADEQRLFMIGDDSRAVSSRPWTKAPIEIRASRNDVVMVR